MKQLNSIYRSLPVWLQDVAVTAQGALYYRQRYGGSFREEYDLLKATERASPLQLELLQVARVKKMLFHAATHVPFYQSRVPNRSWEKLRAGDWSSFYDLPITEKPQLRTEPESFLTNAKSRTNWIEWNSSGTTGSPLQLFYEPEAVSRQYAYVERYREEAGASRFQTRAQFTGKMIVPGDQSSRYWRYDWANRALMLSSVHLNPATIPQYLKALRDFQPAYLTGYPSAIALLARHALRFPNESLRISSILTSAETLLPDQRESMESAFGARVYDQYGQTEMQSFWSECRYRRMHAHPLFGLTEILRPDGSACRPGETGDVVLTGLLNRAMPLLRYRVGDRAAWSDEDRCPCGRNMPIVERIEGRREDYLYTTQRGWVGRMDPALKGVNGILECQFVQEKLDQIRVLLVPASTFSGDDRTVLEGNLKDRLGSRVQIRFEIVDQIPRGPNGKFRAVVSQNSNPSNDRRELEEIA